MIEQHSWCHAGLQGAWLFMLNPSKHYIYREDNSHSPAMLCWGVSLHLLNLSAGSKGYSSAPKAAPLPAHTALIPQVHLFAGQGLQSPPTRWSVWLHPHLSRSLLNRRSENQTRRASQGLSPPRAEICICPFLWILLAYSPAWAFLVAALPLRAFSGHLC